MATRGEEGSEAPVGDGPYTWPAVNDWWPKTSGGRGDPQNKHFPPQIFARFVLYLTVLFHHQNPFLSAL